jgi:hypothetical protein
MNLIEKLQTLVVTFNTKYRKFVWESNAIDSEEVNQPDFVKEVTFVRTDNPEWPDFYYSICVELKDGTYAVYDPTIAEWVEWNPETEVVNPY